MDRSTKNDTKTPADMIIDPSNNDEIEPQSIDIAQCQSIMHHTPNRLGKCIYYYRLVLGLDNIVVSMEEIIAKTKAEVRILDDSIR